MHTDVQREGNVSIYRFRGPLTTGYVKSFVKEVYDLIGNKQTQIIIDLSEVKMICLMGMVSISNIYNECRQNSGALKVAGLTPQVKRVFQQTNLINTIEIFESVSEAYKSF